MLVAGVMLDLRDRAAFQSQEAPPWRSRIASSLTDEQRASCADWWVPVVAPARMLTRARILLKSDHSEAVPAGPMPPSPGARRQSQHRLAGPTPVHRAGPGSDTGIASGRTGSMTAAWTGRRKRSWWPSPAASRRTGHARWSLRLLADEMVRLEVVETISYETVRQALKKTS